MEAGTPSEAATASAFRSARTLAVITSVRIVASPVIVALVTSHDYTAGAILFLVAAVTDWFDGRLARSWGTTSKLGAFLDTTADKLLVASALIALLAVQRSSPWVALVIIAREFTILGLRTVVVSEGRNFEVSSLGKWKAATQFAAIALAMLRPHVTIGGAFLDEWIMIVAAVITGWSGIDYVIRFRRALRT